MLQLSGTKVAQLKKEEVKSRAQEFFNKYKRYPGLAVIVVGEDAASHVYVKHKVKACEQVQIRSFHHHLRNETTQEELVALIEKLNCEEGVDGILVQIPLPKHINQDAIVESIDPAKDADGLNTVNMGRLFVGRPLVAPCTPRGIIELLNHYDIPISGKNCVVIGRSQIVGRPMAQLLLLGDATVTVAHSRTKDLRAITSQADIVVVAAGKPRFLGADDFKKGAVVIDVGIHRLFEGLSGDVRYEELMTQAHAATPVPGGVGPMTIAMLLENTLILANERKRTP